MNLCHPQLSSLARFSPSSPSRPTARPNPISIQGGWQSFPRIPEINPSSPSSIQGYARAIDARLSGSPENRAAITRNGMSPWTNDDGRMNERVAVGWALQQNPKVNYDADNKTFFVQDATGRRQDIASLEEVTGVIQQAGGVRSDNGAAMQVVGSFLAGRIPKRDATVLASAERMGPAAIAERPGPAADAPRIAAPTKGKRKKKGFFSRITDGVKKLLGGEGGIGGMIKKVLGGGKGILGGALQKVLGGVGGLLGNLTKGGLGGIASMMIPAPLRALIPLLSGGSR